MSQPKEEVKVAEPEVTTTTAPEAQQQQQQQEGETKERSHRPARSDSTKSNNGSADDADDNASEASSIEAEAMAMNAIAAAEGENKTGDDAAAASRPILESKNSVFVTGFPAAATKEELKKFFDEKTGACLDIILREGKPRGSTPGVNYAFVFFSSTEAKDVAVALQGTEFSAGYSLNIEERETRTRERRDRSRGRGGRSRSPRGRGGDRDRCFTCGGIGHKARECPSSRGAARGSSRYDDRPSRRESDYDRDRSRGDRYSSRSSRYDDRPPRRDELPPRSGGRGDDIKCYNCGRTGHISARCPDREGRRPRSRTPPRGAPERRRFGAPAMPSGGDDYSRRSRLDDYERRREEDRSSYRRDYDDRRPPAAGGSDFGAAPSYEDRSRRGGYDEYERRRI